MGANHHLLPRLGGRLQCSGYEKGQTAPAPAHYRVECNQLEYPPLPWCSRGFSRVVAHSSTSTPDDPRKVIQIFSNVHIRRRNARAAGWSWSDDDKMCEVLRASYTIQSHRPGSYVTQTPLPPVAVVRFALLPPPHPRIPPSGPTHPIRTRRADPRTAAADCARTLVRNAAAAVARLPRSDAAAPPPPPPPWNAPAAVWNATVTRNAAAVVFSATVLRAAAAVRRTLAIRVSHDARANTDVRSEPQPATAETPTKATKRSTLNRPMRGLELSLGNLSQARLFDRPFPGVGLWDIWKED